MMTNKFSDALRKHADKIDSGKVKTSRMIIMLDDPSIIEYVGFDSEVFNRHTAHEVVEAWRDLLRAEGLWPQQG